MKVRKFKLSDAFIEPYKTREVPWGPLGYTVYKRTYARRLDEFEPGAVGTEEWWQTCRRVIEGMFSIQKKHIQELGLDWSDAKAQRMAKDAYERMFIMKWTPPGRGLWCMGTDFVENRTAAALFNCFSAETNILACINNQTTPELVSIGSLGNGTWIETLLPNALGQLEMARAQVQCFGKQQLQTVIFKPKLRTNYRMQFNTTADHRWILSNGTDTTNLKIGDEVKISPVNVDKTCFVYEEGFAHGLIFGNGTVSKEYPHRHMIRLCPRNHQYLNLLQSMPWHKSTVYCESNEGDPLVTLVLDDTAGCAEWKKIPTSNMNHAEYLAGFLDGWIAADAWKKPAGTICLDTESIEGAEWLKNWAPIAGYTIRGHGIDNRDTNYGPRTNPLQRFTLSRDPTTYKVESITPYKIDTAWCLTVPYQYKFMLAGGLVTGNCAFGSTKDFATKGGQIYEWIMDALMLGIGVGFDTLGAGTCIIKQPGSVSYPNNYFTEYIDNLYNSYSNSNTADYKCLISDSREGWVESVRVLLDSFIFGYPLPEFDYSNIRAAGQPIRGFGGVSSGAQPLIELHQSLVDLYTQRIGQQITSVDLVDTENLIGRCVVAGNIRRSASIALGSPDDREFLTMKNDQEQLAHHRWASNNSYNAKIGMDYTWHAQQAQINGEPGTVWLSNFQNFGRFKDGMSLTDLAILGLNPCGEIGLEDRELCNVPETYPARHTDLNDYLQTVKIAYMYGKTITLTRTHWKETNAVMQKNRRIGLSQAGVSQAIHKFGLRTVLDWSDKAYEYIQELDVKYSDWLCIPRSKKTTSIKPGGSVPLLPGATPGIHFPEDEYYIRRIRFASSSDMLPVLEAAGYHVEPCKYSPNTMVVSFPIKEEYFVRGKRDISMWEQLELAAAYQHYWADNSVSVTVTFKPEEAASIQHALSFFETKLKAVSFLRYEETGYEQAPYEPITPLQYEEMISKITPIQRFEITQPGEGTKFCDGETCKIDWAALAQYDEEEEQASADAAVG